MDKPLAPALFVCLDGPTAAAAFKGLGVEVCEPFETEVLCDVGPRWRTVVIAVPANHYGARVYRELVDWVNTFVCPRLAPGATPYWVDPQ